mmetsp:Transcript_19955/g.45958  ORF Transcript_19955/g.45958 Transcript_19955/m.45958 type:complete len:289 (-) Transcript_19955:101-967(-)
MCLDNLEALVHQRGRVNRDLGAHIPVRVGRRLLAYKLRILLAQPEELFGREVAESSPARCQNDAAKGVGGDPLQGLEDGRMLAVSWSHHHVVLAEKGKDGGAARNQSLLVGQSNVLASLNRLDRGEETSAPDDTGDDTVSITVSSDIVDAIGAAHELGHVPLPPLEGVLECSERFVVLYTHNLGVELLDLLRQELHVGPRREPHDLERVGEVVNDVECLGTDRTRAAQEGDLLLKAVAGDRPVDHLLHVLLAPEGRRPQHHPDLAPSSGAAPLGMREREGGTGRSGKN